MEKVQVLLSTYNGEKYIKEQINSILNQKDVQVSILIRDDGSFDKTVDILKEFSSKNNNITFYTGANIGPAKSFMDLINNSEECNYYAFADQDDVWEENKLISAIEKLKESETKPSLYISALNVVDENLNNIELKKVNGNFTFEGEMIKNFATGCTQVFNKKLRDIIKMYNPSYIIMHDSWITRVCYSIGGNVIIDENSYIKYRQHSKNVLGYKDDGVKKLKRQLKIAFKDNISMRPNIAKELKKGYENMLTQDATIVINKLLNYKNNFKDKFWLIFNKKFRTNSFKVNFKMWVAILLGKF